MDQVLVNLVPGEGSRPGSQVADFSVSSHGKRGEKAQVLSHHRGTSSNPNYLPESPPPNTITSEVGLQLKDSAEPQAFSPYQSIILTYVQLSNVFSYSKQGALQLLGLIV